jgi:prepilin-type processing-associated H-X9-DG protein
VTLDTGQPQTLPTGGNNPDYQKVSNRVTMASVTDGTSNTAMFAETTRSIGSAPAATEIPATSLQNVYYISFTGYNSVEPQATCRSSTTRLVYRGQQYYRSIAPMSFYSHTMTPNAKQYDCSNSEFFCSHTASRSYHPGGVNVAFADGSIRFIKDTINIATWRALGTRGGGEVVSADAY